MAGIPKCDQLIISGMIFETNCRFSSHVKIKLTKANKCLHVLRCLRKEGYNQQELHHLFISLVLPDLTYGLSVYGASEVELATVQAFLDRCCKRKFTLDTLDIRELMKHKTIEFLRMYYLILLFHYCVILPYLVKRTRKI